MAPAVAEIAPDLGITEMVDSLKSTLLNSFRQLLRPLVRILLRHGVSFAEFQETSKIVFVEVAEKDFFKDTERDKSIAAITGLPPREVSRITQVIKIISPPSNENLNRIGRILSGWHQDPLFTGPYGLPLELPIDTEPNSFFELARRYSPDVDGQAMLKELVRVGVVQELPGNRVRVLTRAYIPDQSDSAIVQFMGVALRDLAETLDLNLGADDDSGYFERRVWTPQGISPMDLPHFELLVNEKGQEFLETLDNWLTSREADAESLPANAKIKVGVGVYLFSNAQRKFQED
ncbi:MAG: hypothetical protein D6816_19210 [Bacteroidetes bacterium]|nr:MAG: hypothetical protein D6816_19210 [Bacteroidota bacterium]